MFVLLSLTRLVIKRHFEIDSPRFLSRLFLADDDDPADVPLCTENKFFLSPSPTVWRGSIFLNRFDIAAAAAAAYRREMWRRKETTIDMRPRRGVAFSCGPVASPRPSAPALWRVSLKTAY